MKMCLATDPFIFLFLFILLCSQRQLPDVLENFVCMYMYINVFMCVCIFNFFLHFFFQFSLSRFTIRRCSNHWIDPLMSQFFTYIFSIFWLCFSGRFFILSLYYYFLSQQLHFDFQEFLLLQTIPLL